MTESDRMRSHPLVLLTLSCAFALGGCDSASEADVDADVPSAARSEPASPAPKARAPKAAPKTEGGAMTGSEAASTASPEPKQALRFDMTQGGEAQTAEKFEKWMDEQGVRVAEGAEDNAAAGANAGAAASSDGAETGAQAQTEGQETRR